MGVKSKVTFNKSIWNDAKRRAALSAVIFKVASEFERDVKTNIRESVPAGKTYRRGRITKAITRNTLNGLRTFATSAGKKRAIVGYNFHRASAPGQPPAIDTGRLINSITVQKLSPLRYRIASSVRYAEPLDMGTRRIAKRPFFFSVLAKHREHYLSQIQAAMAALSK